MKERETVLTHSLECFAHLKRGFRVYLYFSSMQKEKQNQASTSRDVMTAVAQFVSDANNEFEIDSLPGEIEEITDLFLDTDYADNIETRRKMLRCKKFILDFCQVVDVDVLAEIENFSKHHGNV